MNKYKHARLISIWVYFVVSTLVTLPEYQSITEGQNLYLITKILLQLWLVGLYFWLKKDAYGTTVNLWVGIHIIASNIHGQYFSPWYFLSFAQMIIAYSFLFPLPRRQFNIFLFFGSFAFLAVSLYRHEEVFNWVYDSQYADLISATLSASAVAWLAHNFFAADRTYREDMVRKFGIVGVQAAGIVHDIKNMLAAPQLNVELLKKKIPDNHEISGLINSIQSQLIGINRAVNGLNQMVALQDQEKEFFHLRNIVEEVSETLNLHSRKITMEFEGDLQIYSEKALFKSIIFNLIMNSIQAFRKNATQNPWIKVTCEENSLVIYDNAGGFPADILESLEKFRFRSIDGNGMGLFLVWNGMRSLGGNVLFSNTDIGVRIRIITSAKLENSTRRSFESFFRLN